MQPGHNRRAGLVGIASTVWYGAGVADFFLTTAQVPGYLRFLSDDQNVFLAALAGWQVALWAIGLFSGLSAGLALWAKLGWAAGGFAISAMALLVFAISALWTPAPGFAAVAGPAGVALLGVAVLVAGLLWFYARRLRQAGRI